jgi:hypothetical protein
MAHTNDQYELLCKVTRGAVLYCPDCGGMQLRFGNAVLGLTRDDLRAFRRAIAVEHETTLYIGETGAGFTFNTYELRMINQLLDMAEGRLRERESAREDSQVRTRALRRKPMAMTTHRRGSCRSCTSRLMSTRLQSTSMTLARGR